MFGALLSHFAFGKEHMRPRLFFAIPLRMLSLTNVYNPVFCAPFNVRDPALECLDDGEYRIFFSRFKIGEWADSNNWSVGSLRTRDFIDFVDEGDLSSVGHASPDNPIKWHGRELLAFQTYPDKPVRLCVAERSGSSWSKPRVFLDEAAELPWNTGRRVIDPTLVVLDDVLHCYFTGSGYPRGERANLIGHAFTQDPDLAQWTITSIEKPLIGDSPEAPDGVENVTIFRAGSEWRMIYSEGLAKQHLAWARSTDLIKWQLEGPLVIPTQSWMTVKQGAPVVWRENESYLMILMGEADDHRTRLGLLRSPDAIQWTPLPERQR